MLGQHTPNNFPVNVLHSGPLSVIGDQCKGKRPTSTKYHSRILFSIRKITTVVLCDLNEVKRIKYANIQ